MGLPAPRDMPSLLQQTIDRVTLLERRRGRAGSSTPPTPNLPTYAIASGSSESIASGSPSAPPLTLGESSGVTLVGSELVIPTTGIYIVFAAARYATNASGMREVGILHATSGGSGIASSGALSAISGEGTSVETTTLIHCQAGDSLGLSLYQTSGGTLEVVSYSLRVVLS